MNSIGVDCVHKSPFKGALTYKSRFYFGIGITYKNDQNIPPFRGCFNCTHFGNSSQCHCELSPPIWNDSRVNDSTCCLWTNHCLGCSSYTNSCSENPPKNRVLSVAITPRLVRHIIIEFANFLLSKRLFDSSNGLRKIFVLYLRSHKTSRMYANRLEFSNLEAGQKYDILRLYLERRNITQIWVCRQLHPKLCLTWSNSQQTSHMHEKRLEFLNSEAGDNFEGLYGNEEFGSNVSFCHQREVHSPKVCLTLSNSQQTSRR